MGVDLTVKVGPLTFRNPVLPGPSEIVQDAKTVKKCIKHGVGGIVTKTYAYIRLLQGRLAPTYCFFNPVGNEYKGILGHGVLLSGPAEKIIEKEMPTMRKLCSDAEIPLIVSIVPTGEVDRVVDMARKFSDAGADGIELNTGCGLSELERWKTTAKKIGLTDEQSIMGYTVGRDIQLVQRLIRETKKSVGCPVFLKLHPFLESVEEYVRKYVEAGADGFSAHDGFGTAAIIDVENETQFFSSWPTGGTVGTQGLRLVSLGKIVRIKKALPDVYVSGIGGIWNYEHALQYMLVGCSTVQVATAIFYRGFGLFKDIIDGINSWMERKGYSTIEEFVGNALKSYGTTEKGYIFVTPAEALCPYIPSIDLSKCTFCGICENRCIWDVISVDKEKKEIEVRDEECWSCGLCVGVCPTGAIMLIDRETKEVVWDNRGQAKPHKPKS